MSSENKPRERRNPVGPTARTVGENVRRVRQEVGYTQADLATNLKANGHPIPVTSIGRIESSDRRIEVDDLVAIAVALGVSPLALLLPYARAADDEVEITGASVATGIDVWRWALGGLSLHPDSSADNAAVWLNARRSFPWWLEPGDAAEIAKDRQLWLLRRDARGADDRGAAFLAPAPDLSAADAEATVPVKLPDGSIVEIKQRELDELLRKFRTSGD